MSFDNILTQYDVRVKGASAAVGQFRSLKESAASIMSLLGNVGSLTTGVGTVVGWVHGTIEAVSSLGLAFLSSAANIDSMRLMLESAEGSAESAASAFDRLKGLAFDRGLDLNALVTGYSGLRQAGYDAELAERAVLALGNAVKTVGGGKEELSAVLVNLTQIASMGRLTGDELRETAGYVPQIRKALNEHFGGSTSDFLSKYSGKEVVRGLIAELEKVPQVTGGLKAMFDNLKTAGELAFGTIGNVIAERVQPLIEKFTKWIQFIQSSGTLKKIADQIAGLFRLGGDDSVLLKTLAWVTAALMDLPSIIHQVASYLSGQFDTAGQNVYNALKTAFTIFLTLEITAAIMKVHMAFVQVAKAIALCDMGMATLEALLGPETWINILASLAIGAAVFWSINAAIDKATAGLKGFGDGIKGLPEWDKIHKDAEKLLDLFNASPKGPRHPGGTPPGDEPGLGGKDSGSHFVTPKTAPDPGFGRQIFGGDDLGKLGITAVEIGAMKKKDEVHIVIDGGGDQSLKSIAERVIYQTLRQLGIKPSMG